jgi:PhnB protein
MVSFREAFPILSVDDVDRAVDFYTSVFGLEKTFSFEQDGATAYAYLKLEPLGIGLARRSDDAPEFALWIYADDVDAAAEALRAAGAEEIAAPADQEWVSACARSDRRRAPRACRQCTSGGLTGRRAACSMSP